MSEHDADVRLNQPLAMPYVPDFDLIRPMGSGGFGEVWLATNRTTGQLRAVKVIPLAAPRATPIQRPAKSASLTRLEANLRCRHPNLLQIHHVGKTAEHLFYVMDPADDVSGEPASDKPDYRPATLQSTAQDRTAFARRLFELRPATAGRLGDAALGGHGPSRREAGQLPVRRRTVETGRFRAVDRRPIRWSPAWARKGTCRPTDAWTCGPTSMPPGLVIYEMLSGLPVDEFPRLGRQSKAVGSSPILTGLLRLVLRACEREPEKRPADARAMLAELDSAIEDSPTLLARRSGQSPAPAVGGDGRCVVRLSWA